MRKARELDFNLPSEEAHMVDNRNWRKLLDMEKRAYKLVEQCFSFVSQAATGNGAGIVITKTDDDDEDEDIVL